MAICCLPLNFQKFLSITYWNALWEEDMFVSSQVGKEKNRSQNSPTIVVYLVGKEERSSQLTIERELEVGAITAKLRADIGPRLRASFTSACNRIR